MNHLIGVIHVNLVPLLNGHLGTLLLTAVLAEHLIAIIM